MADNALIFMYPFDFFYNIKGWEQKHFDCLNDLLDIRYRQTGHDIYFVTYKNKPVDSRIRVESSDIRMMMAQVYLLINRAAGLLLQYLIVIFMD